MILDHVTTKEMVKKLLSVIENRVEKSKVRNPMQSRNLETTL
jgi:hypothetical protein